MDNESIAYIELFGVTLSGVKAPTDGLYWTELEGWWGLPDLKSNSDSIPGAHGSFRRHYSYRESRSITLTGHILADSNAGLVAVRDRLERALSSSVDGVMRVVTTSYGAWSRTVEVDTLEIEPDHGRSYTKFTVDMVANDPIRYMDGVMIGPVGLPVKHGGLRLPKRFPWNFGDGRTLARLTVHNVGSAPLYPTVFVSGGFSTLVVRDLTGGSSLEYGAPVESGQQITLDSRNSQAVIGGRSVTRNMTRREWFEIPPGESHTFEFRVTGRVGDPMMSIWYEIGAW